MNALNFEEVDTITVKKEEDDSGAGFTMDVRESEPIDLSKLFGTASKEKETSSSKLPKITLAQALSKLQSTNPVPTVKPSHDCQSCINSLVPIEKNLQRMENKMAAMVTMVKKRQSMRAMKTPIVIPRAENQGRPSWMPPKIQSMAKQEYLEKKVVIRSPFAPGPSSAGRSPGAVLPKKRLVFTPLGQKTSGQGTSSGPAPAFVGHKIVDPKREEARFQVARSKFLQAFLLFPGREFAYGNFVRQNQDIAQNLTVQQKEEILEQLIEDGLMFQKDEDEPPKTHPRTVWMKETAKYKLRGLKHYPVTVNDFIESFYL